MRNKKPSLSALLTIMLFDHTSLNIVFPVLVLLFFDLQSKLFPADTSQAVRSMWYGLCVAIPHIMNIVATPILSSLSDVLGRKKILLVGTFGAFLFAITSAFGVLWGTLSLFFFGRVIQGIFSRTNPIGQAIIADISPEEKKVLHMGYLQTSITLGAFIGPIIGGYFANSFMFDKLNYSLPFFISTLFAAISCLLAILFFKESFVESKRSRNKFDWLEIKATFANPSVLQITIILLLSQVSWSFYYQFIPPILKSTLNFNAHQIGVFVAFIAFWLAITPILGIKILMRFYDLQQMLKISTYLLLTGTIITSILCLLNLPENGTKLIWIAAIPTASGDMISYSCLITLYSNVVEKQQQGKVMGLCFITIALTWSLTGLFGGLMMSMNTLLPLIVAPLGVLGAFVILHRESALKAFGQQVKYEQLSLKI